MTKPSIRGFTIIEFMVSLLISGLIVAAAFAVYLSTRQTSRYSDALSRYQESLRYAQLKLSEDLRMAGSTGCYQIRMMDASSPKKFLSNYGGAAGMPADLSFTEAIKGYERVSASYSPTLPTHSPALTASAGDIVQVKYADADSRALNADMTALNGSMIVTSTNAKFVADDIAVVEYCDGADVFRISAAAFASGAQTLTPVAALSTKYEGVTAAKRANVHKFISRYWYVRTVGGKSVLTRRSAVGSGASVGYIDEDIADGIEDMQILYGEDNTPAASASDVGVALETNQFRTANNVTAWRNVVSARVCLMTVSADNGLATVAQSYTDCNGTAQTATDLRLRFPLTFTVKLRNQSLPTLP
jgi:type IV pilus assembly protein PilW